MTEDHNPLGPLGKDGENAESRFADQLEVRLRVAHASRGEGAAVPLWRRAVLIAPVMVVVLLAASVALAIRDETPSAALVLTEASNVTVVLPDGTVIDDPVDGLVLVDGAMLQIHDGGAATIDDVVVDTEAVFTVRDGALVSDVAGTTTTDRITDSAAAPPVTDAPTSTAPPTTDQATTTAQAPATSEPVDPASSRPPPGPPIDHPDPPGRPDGVPGPPSEPPSDHPSPSGPPADHGPPSDVALEIGLRAQLVDGGVRLTWSVVGAEPGWTTMVIRSTAPRGHAKRMEGDVDAVLADPEFTAVAEAAAGSGEVVDAVELGDGRLQYGVVVLDAARGIVGSSPVQTVSR